MKVYFIADLHFGHRNIIGFDNRPWDSLQSMEAEMIRRWNERVTDRDHVFIVGDFCAFSSMSHAAAILRRLKGHKHLIRGNHDLREPVFDSFFEDVTDYRQITVRAFGEKQNLVLCHYFRPFFRGARQGGIHLYGHTHNSRVAEMEERFQRFLGWAGIQCEAYNVGACRLDYTPRTLEEIIGIYRPDLRIRGKV